MISISTIGQGIDQETLRLNRNISSGISLEKLKTLIEIDSIRPIPERMDMLYSDSLVYIEKSYLEYYKEGGYCVLSKVVLDQKITNISLNSILFDKQSSYQDVKKMFYDECSELYSAKNHRDVNAEFYCKVTIDKCDCWMFFYFFDEKLIGIYIYSPS